MICIKKKCVPWLITDAGDTLQVTSCSMTASVLPAFSGACFSCTFANLAGSVVLLASSGIFTTQSKQSNLKYECEKVTVDLFQVRE